ncbi:TIGR03915 family putative DNA repair protein [Verrucomicrobiaceae bacterium R5-34]|nr:TIGR03915 family putative DNA repair protein [Verrucomicrobiaceae bacterium R5-34]
MKNVKIQPSFDAWRRQARQLLAQQISPAEVLWSTKTSETADEFDFSTPSITQEDPAEYLPTQKAPDHKVPRAFVRLAESVACHRSDQQWSLLYELLWQITVQGDRSLLKNQTDARMLSLQKMRASIRRDIHKMRAFVRFKLIEGDGEEHYVAWFEPEHRIVRVNAPFFRKRFTGMKWSILSPDECAHWDGRQMEFSEGVSKDQVPKDEDALERYWLAYYRNIFNPARVKIKMMQSEMPKKYWKNLPEAEVIEELIQTSHDQVLDMMDRHARAVKPLPSVEYLEELHRMNQEE